MIKLCVVPLLALAMSWATRAQETIQSPPNTEDTATGSAFNTASEITTAPLAEAKFATAGPQSVLGTFHLLEWTPPPANLAFARANEVSAIQGAPYFGFARPVAFATFAEPSPEPPAPRFVYGERSDFRWQLGLGISLVRFRSSFFYATGVGTDTSLTYFTNEWFGLEGRVTTAFAGTIFTGERVKYVGYGFGPKIAWRTRKVEPFVHLIVGGAHLTPKIAAEGQNGFEFQAGGGAGYRLNPRLSARVVVDWVRTRMFGQWQDNAQAALQAVLHF